MKPKQIIERFTHWKPFFIMSSEGDDINRLVWAECFLAFGSITDIYPLPLTHDALLSQGINDEQDE